ncbi:MAG: aminotransferase class I/II-fold pyridoxal phosphate-dependent enzyme [Lachnospiraceae bacterium]|nr:aminotransferase class I/II-fold pyridoxal phosphate-dependent enzyme [Lachnospiraceae bacterium]
MKYDFDRTLDHRKDASYRWEQTEGRDDILGMGTADLDFACAPCVKEACARVLEENTYNYRKKTGEYFDAVKSFYRRNYGLSVKEEWLSDSPGTLGAIRMAVDIFSEKGDYVLMQAPHFDPLKVVIEGAGRRLLTNPMIRKGDRYELDLGDFEEKIRSCRPAIFLLVNPHNPSGKVFSQEELEKMVEICERYEVKILSDEVHCLVMYENARHIPILAVSEKAKKISIQVMSMSKGFNTMSLPHAILAIADPELRKIWNPEFESYWYHYAVNSFALAAVTTIAKGEADEWQKELTAYLKRNLDTVRAFAEEKRLPLTFVLPQAGFLLWIDCKEAWPDEREPARRFLEEAGISMLEGAEFGEEGNGFVRMNFAVTHSVLTEALDRIGRMFSR